MKMIQVEHLTKDYGFGRGKSLTCLLMWSREVFGFLGPNGAGKTTTIRHIMGFSKPQEGNDQRAGERKAGGIQPRFRGSWGICRVKSLFPANLTGTQFIRHMGALRGLTD